MLATVYKQINAPVGKLGLNTLATSTAALSSADDTTYNSLENNLISVGTQRDAIAGQIIQLLEGAEFRNQTINPLQALRLWSQAAQLLESTK